MEQISIFNDIKKIPLDACVFTGHRQLDADFSKQKLEKAIETLLREGIFTFYNGMAMGFDMLAAETTLELKKKYPQIRLIACIPCYGQEKYFSETDKKRYVRILQQADEKRVLSDHYYNGCMQMRDRYMVQRADRMIAYCNKTEGGAAFTVRCFQKEHPSSEIIFL